MCHVEVRLGKERFDSDYFVFCGDDRSFHSFKFALLFPFQFARSRLPVAGIGDPSRSAFTQAGMIDPGYRALPFLEVVIVISNLIAQHSVAFKSEDRGANAVEKITIVAHYNDTAAEGDERFFE